MEVGPIKTVRYFESRDITIAESTVCYIRNLYIKEQKTQKADTPKFIKQKRGRKLLIGELDEKL